MQDVIDPDDIHTSFKDIAGIDGIKQELQDMIFSPSASPNSLSNTPSSRSPREFSSMVASDVS